MIGHMDDRYRWFGWASARLDDVANFLPARITALLLVLSVGIVSRSWPTTQRALRILLRDGRQHPSPNSGRPEAAMAGALGVQLGGLNRYDGLPIERPCLGDPDQPLTRTHIGMALTLMLWASLSGNPLEHGMAPDGAEMTQPTHGGNVYKVAQEQRIPVERIMDFSASINPLGPPVAVLRAIRSALKQIAHYPDPDCWQLRQELAQQCGVDPDMILVGNGSTELIHLLPRALAIKSAPHYRSHV